VNGVRAVFVAYLVFILVGVAYAIALGVMGR
jgi:hypothetical protein